MKQVLQFIQARENQVLKDNGYSKSASLYDLFAQEGDLDFYGRYATRAGRALDIGAGTGRLAMPLAQRGVEMVCVEPSAAMIGEFRKKLKDRPDLASRISLVHADAASFHLEETFPAAFMAGSFDHFGGDSERLASLSNIAGHLDPGAMLILDSYWGLMSDAPLRLTDRVQVGEKRYLRHIGRQVQPDRTMKITLIYEIYRGDRLQERIEQHSRAGIIERKRIHELLAGAGFRVAAEYRDYDRSPYRDGDELLLIEAERM